LREHPRIGLATRVAHPPGGPAHPGAEAFDLMHNPLPMTSTGRIISRLLPLLLAVGACGSSQNKAPDAGLTHDAPDCSMLPGWTRWDRVDAGGTTSAHVAGGALTMTATDLPGTCQAPVPACPTGLVHITQGGPVQGDFEATVTFEAFQGTGPGGAAGLVIALDIGNAYAFIRQTDAPQLEVMVTGMGTASMPTSMASGTLRVARNAGMVTATATAGGTTVALTGTGSTGGQFLAALGIYNRSETANPGVTSIHFTNFAFTGGGAEVLPDAFECDSVP